MKEIFPELEEGFEEDAVRQTAPHPVMYLVCHHTGGSDANPLLDTSQHTFEQVNEYHRLKWNFKSSLGYYIGYQYYIDKNGKVTQGRADTEEGAHTIGANNSSIGICLAGNFDATDPSDAQIRSLQALLKKKMIQYSVPLFNIVPHRKFQQKTCYGNKLSDDWAQSLVRRDLLAEMEVTASRLVDLISQLKKQQ